MASFSKLRKHAATLLLPASVFAIANLLHCFDATLPLEHSIMNARFQMAQRPATKSLTIVEIDTASLRALDTWPWPRDYYAKAVDALFDAGATQIAFDVDFSAASSKAGDAEFADALARHGDRVALAVFLQADGTQGGFVETIPNAAFRPHVDLVSVNLFPELNGQVRRAQSEIHYGDAARTTFSAHLAGADGRGQGEYYIDLGIRPSTIDRISFKDLLSGDFDPRLVAGRNIMIGAAAIELGDEFAVPLYGILPGVVLHGLAYESIVQGRAIHRANELAVHGFTLLGVIILTIGAYRGGAAAPITHVIVLTGGAGAAYAAYSLAAVNLDLAPLLISQGGVAAVQFFQELRRRAAALQKEQRTVAYQRSLIEATFRDAADGVIVTDSNGGIEMANAAAQTLLGADDLQRHGRSLFDVNPSLEFVKPVVLSGDDASHALDEIDEAVFLSLEDANGDERVLEARCFYSEIDDRHNQDTDAQSKELRIYKLRDVTARKRMEEAERAAKEAELRAARVKGQMLSNMSHELRTPLNSVIGFSDIIAKQIFGDIGQKQYVEYAQQINLSGQNLLGVINDVLEAARLESGEIDVWKEKTQLKELIQSAIDHDFPVLDKAERRFDVQIEDGLETAKIDQTLISKALLHLISNAIKFTTDSGRIGVAVARRNDGLEISVADDGPGVSPELLDQLTNAFFQGDGARNRKQEGCGLGLSIAGKCAELHGGRLVLESEEGAGFTARIWIPVTQDAPNHVAQLPDTDELKRAG